MLFRIAARIPSASCVPAHALGPAPKTGHCAFRYRVDAKSVVNMITWRSNIGNGCIRRIAFSSDKFGCRAIATAMSPTTGCFRSKSFTTTSTAIRLSFTSALPRTAISFRHSHVASSRGSNAGSHRRPKTYSTNTVRDSLATARASIATSTSTPSSFALAAFAMRALSSCARISSVTRRVAISPSRPGLGSRRAKSWKSRIIDEWSSPSTDSRLSSGRHAGVATCLSSASPFTTLARITAVATSGSVTFTSRWPRRTPNAAKQSLRAAIVKHPKTPLQRPFLFAMMIKFETRYMRQITRSYCTTLSSSGVMPPGSDVSARSVKNSKPYRCRKNTNRCGGGGGGERRKENVRV
eukprot:31391-Pelagococcus_subviridis.AAC.12